MKTLATLHAKELYDVIRFPADTSGEHIPDPDGGGRKPVLTLHTYSGCKTSHYPAVYLLCSIKS